MRNPVVKENKNVKPQYKYYFECEIDSAKKYDVLKDDDSNFIYCYKDGYLISCGAYPTKKDADLSLGEFKFVYTMKDAPLGGSFLELISLFIRKNKECKL